MERGQLHRGLGSGVGDDQLVLVRGLQRPHGGGAAEEEVSKVVGSKCRFVCEE